MTALYPNLCYNEVCYNGTALYLPVHYNTNKFTIALAQSDQALQCV